MAKPDVSNLANCIEEVRLAALDSDPGPPDPVDYNELRGRLEASRGKLPPLYRDAIYDPFVTALDELGPTGFVTILLRDPTREREAGLLLDIAQAIIQNGEGYREKATDGFQEVVSDLYDGFLSAEDRQGVKLPDLGVIAPLVKWGRPSFGPYTWTVNATTIFGLNAAIVNLPPANAQKAIMAWAALSHETAGHDILHADDGLLQELARVVRKTLSDADVGHGLPDYWADRMDETASDVLGILNMGPAAGIGLIAYFRGLNAAFTGSAKLRNRGPAADPHPADIVRGYLAASTVRLLSFDQRTEWANLIESETDKDATKIVLAWAEVPKDKAAESARIVAEAIADRRLESLEEHSLREIQDWRNKDEELVQRHRVTLNRIVTAEEKPEGEYYAAHAVAAAVTSALSKGANLSLIFDRMVGELKRMHDENPSWGPLYVRHPGDLVSMRAYSRE